MNNIIDFGGLAAVTENWDIMPDGIPMPAGREAYTGVNVSAMGVVLADRVYLAQLIGSSSESSLSALRGIVFHARKKKSGRRGNASSTVNHIVTEIKYAPQSAAQVMTYRLTTYVMKTSTEWTSSDENPYRIVSGSDIYRWRNSKMRPVLVYSGKHFKEWGMYLLTTPYKERERSLYVQLYDGISALTNVPVPRDERLMAEIWRECIKRQLITGSPYLVREPESGEIEIDRVLGFTDLNRLVPHYSGSRFVPPMVANMLLHKKQGNFMLAEVVARIVSASL